MAIYFWQSNNLSSDKERRYIFELVNASLHLNDITNEQFYSYIIYIYITICINYKNIYTQFVDTLIWTVLLIYLFLFLNYLPV